MSPFETEQRLKGYLDTNQLQQERMCRAVLAIDKRFSNVNPRHPRGGPDGGRDIEAVFERNQRAFGAVGFVVQANDTAQQKRAIKKKFGEDLASAVGAEDKPAVFVFFTNVNLTLGEKEELKKKAIAAGVSYCEVFDRERIRIALDSPDGLAIRFQYLGIPLSEAEQASFFAKWGDDIQSVIATGFQRIQRTLDRVIFLQEANSVLGAITVHFELDRTYSAEEIGHFRAFCLMLLKEPKLKILQVVFGSSDKSNRMRSDIPFAEQPSGIKHGIGGGQWEQHIDVEADDAGELLSDEPLKLVQVGSFSSVGEPSVKSVYARYSHDQGFIRFWPRIYLRDIDEAGLLPLLNKSLAEKVRAIHVYANGYKLLEAKADKFFIDNTEFDPGVPASFSDTELADSWVRIRPKNASYFEISFFHQTPRRLFESLQTPDSLANSNE